VRRVLQTLAAIAGLGAAGGAAVVFLGLYNVSARSGHLPGVSWVLHTTYRNAVELRAPAPDSVPPLDDTALVALGARHFDNACRFCHAAPGETRSAMALSMVPQPPHITEAVSDWAPRHLHWIVHEGVKMSGMPGWPAERKDDVWAVVAFLDRVGRLDGPAYGTLTAPPAGAPAGSMLTYCATCHGTDGRGELAPHVPRLDIQDEAYLSMSLASYRGGWRESGIMQQAASRLTDAEIEAMALHFASAAPEPMERPAAPAELVERGRALAAAATDDPEVPACESCHGPRPGKVAEGTPSLAGQHRAYLEAQLRLWRDALRGGGPRANVMRKVAAHLSDGDIDALSAYYASLAPAKLSPQAAGASR
jgi:cytochrome c553